MFISSTTKYASDLMTLMTIKKGRAVPVQNLVNQMREDWVEVELGKFFKVTTGNTPSKKESDNYEGEIPFVKPPNLWNSIIQETAEYLTEKGASKSRILPMDSVLVTCIGNLGRTGLNKRTVAFNQQINAIEPQEGINSKFTFYQAQNPIFRSDLESRATATTVTILNKGNFEKVKYRIAPLPEQRAIVAKIEELFSELDSGIQNLKTGQAQLKIYRQAVLKKAFEGGFTNDDVKEGELPEGWKWVKLESISQVSGGLTKNSKRDLLPLQIPYLRVANVYANHLDLNVVKTIGITEGELKRVLLAKNDLLIVEGNGSPDQIGRAALWNGVLERCIHQNHLIKVRFLSTVVPKYILYWLLSSEGRDRIKRVSSSTSGLYTLNLSKVKALEAPLCSCDKQTQIVQEIESRLSVCDKMEESITESLLKAEALRQSILKKAFEGKLLSEAELSACRKDADWEPAGKLVERVRKEVKHV